MKQANNYRDGIMVKTITIEASICSINNAINQIRRLLDSYEMFDVRIIRERNKKIFWKGVVIEFKGHELKIKMLFNKIMDVNK